MNRVKELRLKAGLQQKDIAIALNIKQSAISQWETQKSDPKPENIPRLAKFFNVPAESIIYENVPQEMQTPHGVAYRRVYNMTEDEIDALMLRMREREMSYDPQIDTKLIAMLQQLTPYQVQRVKDFVEGLKASDKE